MQEKDQQMEESPAFKKERDSDQGIRYKDIHAKMKRLLLGNPGFLGYLIVPNSLSHSVAAHNTEEARTPKPQQRRRLAALFSEPPPPAIPAEPKSSTPRASSLKFFAGGSVGRA